MAIGRFFVVGVAALLAGGCPLFFPPIRSDLTASVEGVVGEDDIHKIAGGYFTNRESSWTMFGSRRGQLLHVRLSTSRDLVSLSYRKHLGITVRWHFCDDAQQEVYLGEGQAFVNGTEVWGLSTPSPARDGTGRFVYDVVLHVRDARPEEDRRRWGSGVVKEAFDLELEPRDVCVALWLITKMGGYRTTDARIPREEIAAALGVEVASGQIMDAGAGGR